MLLLRAARSWPEGLFNPNPMILAEEVRLGD